ncbi:MAG: glycosyltransferase [Candidatus Levybacteria bacterium]|nr:glycosyltransferase [Candidatus Levybacteria bacterium]
MRIGIFTHNYPSSIDDRKDAGGFIYDFAHELSKKVPVYIHFTNFENKSIQNTDIPLTVLDFNLGKKPSNWNMFSPLSIFRFYRFLHKAKASVLEFVKKNDLDFCLAAWVIPSGILVNHVKAKMQIPYGIWCLGSDINKYAKYPILRTFIKKALNEADIIFANSFYLNAKIERLTNRKSVFLPATTSTLQPKHPWKRKQNAKYSFLFIGRLERIKGPDTLIDACIALQKLNNDFIVYIGGGGSLQKQLQKKVTDYDLQNIVKFLGWVGQKQCAEYMHMADCLVVPSRSESLPLVVIEAARAQLPVICTDVGDCPRIITNYNIGYIVPSNNPEKLADTMNRVMHEKELLQKKSKDGFRRILQEFDVRYSVLSFLKILKQNLYEKH